MWPRIELPSPDFVVRKEVDLRHLIEEGRFFSLAMLRVDAEPLGLRAATMPGDKEQLDHTPFSERSSNRCERDGVRRPAWNVAMAT